MWYDGGTCIELPDHLLALVKDPCWIILAIEREETSANVAAVEELLLHSLKELTTQDIQYDGIKLQVEYLGFTADHGIRSKTLCRINGRCGECSWLFDSQIPYGCLDWGALIETEVISFNNWKHAQRRTDATKNTRTLSALSTWINNL